MPLCRLIERESAKGTRFFTGYLGDAKIVLLPDRESNPDKLYGGIASWQLFIEERRPKQEG
jgi:hypothetical protein